MEALLVRVGSRLPQLLAQASAGNPVAIALLVAAGGAAAWKIIQDA